jgi:hypothetical protein
MRMLPVVILLVGACFALVHAQERTRRTLWSGTVGQRQVVIEERWTPPFTDIQVSARVSAAGRTSTFEISTFGRSPEVVVPWEPDRLVVISGEIASIVDMVAGLVVDQFYATRPSISPTGRFIAYARFRPSQSQDEDVLLVYDLAASNQVNRLPAKARSTEFLRDVGLPVFPEWYVTNQQYQGRKDTADGRIETLRSAVVWASDADFVFLTGRGGSADPEASIAIHHVHVRGAGQPAVLRSQLIDANKLIDLAGYNNPRPATGAPLLHARAIKVLDCAGSACQVEIEWEPTPGLRAPSLQLTF